MMKNEVDAERLVEARKLFFDHDGLTSIMARKGADAAYRLAAVPEDLEERWLIELTSMKMRDLSQAGNWKVVRFLRQHNDFTHTRSLMETGPLGELPEQTAYLEELLAYAQDFCKLYGQPLTHHARIVATIQQHAKSIRESTGDRTLRVRLEQLLAEASHLPEVPPVRAMPEGATRPGSQKKNGGAGVLIDKLCNAFYANISVLSDSAITGAAARLIKPKQSGAWIGGRLVVTDQRLSFAPNRMKGEAALRIEALDLPLAAVTAVKKEFSLMTGIVVVEHEGGVLKFRCFGAKKIAQQLQNLLAAR
jgi:hypothetical protein